MCPGLFLAQACFLCCGVWAEAGRLQLGIGSGVACMAGWRVEGMALTSSFISLRPALVPFLNTYTWRSCVQEGGRGYPSEWCGAACRRRRQRKITAVAWGGGGTPQTLTASPCTGLAVPRGPGQGRWRAGQRRNRPDHGKTPKGGAPPNPAPTRLICGQHLHIALDRLHNGPDLAHNACQGAGHCAGDHAGTGWKPRLLRVGLAGWSECL